MIRHGFSFNERPLLKEIRQRVIEQDVKGPPLAPAHVHKHTYTHTHTPTHRHRDTHT